MRFYSSNGFLVLICSNTVMIEIVFQILHYWKKLLKTKRKRSKFYVYMPLSSKKFEKTLFAIKINA